MKEAAKMPVGLNHVASMHFVKQEDTVESANVTQIMLEILRFHAQKVRKELL